MGPAEIGAGAANGAGTGAWAGAAAGGAHVGWDGGGYDDGLLGAACGIAADGAYENGFGPEMVDGT